MLLLRDLVWFMFHSMSPDSERLEIRNREKENVTIKKYF